MLYERCKAIITKKKELLLHQNINKVFKIQVEFLRFVLKDAAVLIMPC